MARLRRELPVSKMGWSSRDPARSLHARMRTYYFSILAIASIGAQMFVIVSQQRIIHNSVQAIIRSNKVADEAQELAFRAIKVGNEAVAERDLLLNAEIGRASCRERV